MTSDIVPSDIALVERLLVQGRSDEDILAALLLRRVDFGIAKELIACLRRGEAWSHSRVETGRLPVCASGGKQSPMQSEPQPMPTKSRFPTGIPVASGAAAPGVDTPLEAPPPEVASCTACLAEGPAELRDADRNDSGDCPASFTWFKILEILVVGYVLFYSGTLTELWSWLRGDKVAAQWSFAWISWFLRHAVAAGFLAYFLYAKSISPVKMVGARSPQFTVLEFFLVLGLAFQGSILGSIHIAVHDLPVGEPPLTLGGQWQWEFWTMLRHAGSLALLAWVLYRRSGSFASLGLRWSSSDVALALPVAVAAFLVNVSFCDFAYWGAEAVAGREIPTQNLSWALIGPTITLPHVAELLLNGFFEELIVRAFLMTVVLQLTRSGVLAVFCSVVVQVSYHFYQGTPAALGHIGWCLLFSLFYLKTRRILPLILAHNFVNLSTMLNYAAYAP